MLWISEAILKVSKMSSELPGVRLVEVDDSREGEDGSHSNVVWQSMGSAKAFDTQSWEGR
jgi:hypothetical protein